MFRGMDETENVCPWRRCGRLLRRVRFIPCPWNSLPEMGGRVLRCGYPYSSTYSPPVRCADGSSVWHHGDHFQAQSIRGADLTRHIATRSGKRLLGIYMPWMRLDGEFLIPSIATGKVARDSIIFYDRPFYYIDYCLAQRWHCSSGQGSRKTRGGMGKLMAYTKQGGSAVFTDLLKNAGLDNPFGDKCLKEVCAAARKWLEEYDLEGLA